jgi:hypothetical protein
MNELRTTDDALLDKLTDLARDVARSAHGEPFRLPVRHVMNTFKLNDLASASRLLRELERRHVLECVRRGTKDTAQEKGVISTSCATNTGRFVATRASSSARSSAHCSQCLKGASQSGTHIARGLRGEVYPPGRLRPQNDLPIRVSGG